jgi:CIC family chloride channel protein
VSGPRLRLLLAVAVVAVGTGLFAVAFRASLTSVYHAVYGRDNVVDSIAALPWWLRALPPILGAAVAGIIARLRFAAPQGVSNVMEAIALGRIRLSLRTTASRVASSWVAIAGGVSIGREGPLIEVGGALGAGVGRRLGVSQTEIRVLVGAGTAAGFAAAYNTPFAAVLFVLESIAGIAAPELLLPVMAAAVGASAILRATIGAGPIYGQRSFGLDLGSEFPFVILLGGVTALAALAFKQVLSRCERWYADHPMPQPSRAILGGAIVGVVAMGLPRVVGNGYEPLNEILNATPGVGMLLILAAAKVLATSHSVASGIPGGIFTPTLLVGAAVGTASAHLIPGANPGSYALLGMAAATAANIHAPLTAAVMIFELSGDYGIVLPLILVTVVSTAVSRSSGSESLYEAELRKRGVSWELTLEGRRVRRGHDPGDVDSAVKRS